MDILKRKEKKMLIIVSAPSGSGKSTIVQDLLKKRNDLEFSISATTRAPRGTEENGKEYYFLTEEEFRKKIDSGEFIEYQEVYPGCFYGTLASEVARIESTGKHVIFDMDVYGGLNLSRQFEGRSLSLFICPPSIEVLRERLYSRATDTEANIEIRLAKAEEELKLKNFFDVVIYNDDLEWAEERALMHVSEFLDKGEG